MNKETIKTFLKPTKSKVVIAILIFLFLPFPYYVVDVVCIALAGIKCEPHWSVGFIGIGTVIDMLESPSFYNLIHYISAYWQYYIASIFVSYMLSTLIVSTYHKFKK